MYDLPHIIDQSNKFYYLIITYAGECRYANQYFLDGFNCNGLKDASLKFTDTIFKEDREKVLELMRLCKKEPKKSFEIVIRKLSLHGELVHTSWEFMADDTKPEITCIGFDISQRVALTKKTLEFGQKLNQIVDSITDGFYSLDRDWRFTLVNKNFLETINKSREDLIGKCIWDVFPNEEGYSYSGLFKKAMKEGIAEKFEHYRPDLDRWYWGAAYPSDDGLMVFLKDITETKKEKAEVIDSRNKLSAILNSTSEMHILISPEYKVLSFNKAAATNLLALYGKGIKEGSNILEFILPEAFDEFMEDFNKALSGELVRLERPLKFPNGQNIWLRTELSPARNDSNSIIGVVFNLMDIDQLKQYELSLEKSNEQLRAIAYKQSHEMRCPIAQVLGLMYLLKESPGDIEIMKHVEKVAHELDAIVHDIVAQTVEA